MFCMVLQFYIPAHKYKGWEKINNLLVKVVLEGLFCPFVLAGTNKTAQDIYVENSICNSMELMVRMDSFQSDVQPGDMRPPRQPLHQERGQGGRGAAGDAAGSAEVGGAGTSYKYQGEDWRNVGTRDTCTLLGHHWGHILSKNTQNSSLDYEELLEQV